MESIDEATNGSFIGSLLSYSYFPPSFKKPDLESDERILSVNESLLYPFKPRKKGLITPSFLLNERKKDENND